MKHLIISVLFCVIFTFPAFSQKLIGPEEDIESILNQIVKFSSFVMANDYDGIVNCYTSDGKLFPNDQPIIEGPEGIREYWKMPDGVRTTYHKIHPIEIKVKEDEAYDHGTYEGKTQRADGTVSSWKGKYVIIWKKERGEWKMYLDIWNRIKQ